MAGNATIGALKVSLGIDSAQFSAGLKKAQSGLSGFGKTAAIGFAAAATAAVAAGTALAFMGKHAIDAADDLSKTAQKAGVTTEALSRLNYAAGYADVSLDTLSGGLQKLTKNMADVASGKGGSAATAFSALGISVTDASGKLRDSDEVFAQVAEKLSRLENGSTKTALVLQLFGRAGADLIPLLNEGADGLKRYADESDRLGLTVSTKTGKAAEQFNDTLTKVGKIIDGVVMKVAEAALPTLQDFANLLASPQFAQAAQTFGTTLLSVLSGVTQAIVGVTNAARDLFSYLSRGGGVVGMTAGKIQAEIALTEQLLANPNINAVALERSTQYLAQLKAQLEALNTMDPVGEGANFGELSGFGFGTGGGGRGAGLPTFEDTGAAQAMASKLEALRQSLLTEEQLEIDSHAKRLEELQGFYESGAILKGEYDSLLLSAQQQHADAMTEIAKKQVEEETRLREQLVGNVAGIFGSLSSLAESFGEKGLAAAKAFGVAEAIVNTAQGITKALAQGGVFGFVGAAAVAAAGAAQIATILSATKGSGGKPSVGSSGAGAAAAIANPPAASTEPPRAVHINFQGLGRKGMEQFVQELNDVIGDGVKLIVNPA